MGKTVQRFIEENMQSHPTKAWLWMAMDTLMLQMKPKLALKMKRKKMDK